MKKLLILLFILPLLTCYSQSNKSSVDKDYNKFKSQFNTIINKGVNSNIDSIDVDYLPLWILTPPGDQNMFLGISDVNMAEKEGFRQAVSRAIMQSAIIPNCNKFWLNDFFLGGGIDDRSSSMFQEIYMFYNSLKVNLNSIKIINIYMTSNKETVVLLQLLDSESDNIEYKCKTSLYKNNTVESGECITGKIVIETFTNSRSIKSDYSEIYIDYKNSNVCFNSNDDSKYNNYYRYSLTENIQHKYQIVSYSGLWPVYVSSFFTELSDQYNPHKVSVFNVTDNYSQKYMSITRLSSNQDKVFIADSVSVSGNRFVFKFRKE